MCLSNKNGKFIVLKQNEKNISNARFVDEGVCQILRHLLLAEGGLVKLMILMGPQLKIEKIWIFINPGDYVCDSFTVLKNGNGPACKNCA